MVPSTRIGESMNLSHSSLIAPLLLLVLLLPALSSADEPDEASENGPESAASETADELPELVVFDIEFAPDVRLRDDHCFRIEEAYWESILESPRYRALTPSERNRRMNEARQRITDTVDADRADLNSQAIEVPYYLVAGVGVEDEEHYRIVVTIGASLGGEDGRTRFDATVGRRWTEVRAGLVELLQAAVGRQPEVPTE